MHVVFESQEIAKSEQELLEPKIEKPIS